MIKYIVYFVTLHREISLFIYVCVVSTVYILLAAAAVLVRLHICSNLKVHSLQLQRLSNLIEEGRCKCV